MTSLSVLYRSLALLLTALIVGWSCQRETQEPTGGETHFLMRCDPSADACGTGLSCLCGVCTLRCDGPTSCDGYAAAECVLPASPDACLDDANASVCDVRCRGDVDCTTLSPDHTCQQGVCRAGANACATGAVSANEVLLIGDSFIAASHQITAYLEELARGAGALPTGQRYRDNSRLVGNSLALPEEGIAAQYAGGAAEGAVKVVIMTGGGADLLVGSCGAWDASCPVLTDAAEAARTLLARMANDGVSHVIYVFYPDPLDASLKQKVDALRPLLQSACESSPVPCHWLDLRPTFAGRSAEYIQADGVNPTAAGSQASAAAIWDLMQAQCIAQ